MTESPTEFDPGGLAADGYLQERSEPHLGDHLYLHLSDLLLFVKKLDISDQSKILDFGSGGSPYKRFFPDARYFTADISDENNPNYVINAGGTIDESDEFFDVVISTQVAEHVEHYREYLGECNRLLRTGGTFVITVPGMYEDHPCPNDFQRWMAQGLCRDLESSGFTVTKITKLTTGPRAVFLFFDRFLDTMQSSRKTFAGLALFVLRSLLAPFRSAIHWFVDTAYREFRVVDGNDGTHSFYLGLAVEAVKK